MRPRNPQIDQPWFVLLVLFGVTGVLGLPLLVWTRAFSKPIKILLAVLVTLYTAALIWLVWIICLWSWGRIKPFAESFL